MSSLVYELSLSSAISVMSFISVYMLAGPLPEDGVGPRYKWSRRMVGIACLILVANYSVHLFINPRFNGQREWAILLNLCTYFVELPLFSSALMMFMDQHFYPRMQIVKRMHILICGAYVISSVLTMVLFPSSAGIILSIMVILFCCYSLPMGYRLLNYYRKMARLIKDTQSDDIEAKVKWMSVAAFWGVIYGLSCGFLSFLPSDLIYIWVLISIPYYLYLFVSYEGYLIFEGRVQKALEVEFGEEMNDELSEEQVMSDYYREKDRQTSLMVSKWIEAGGYTEKGITIDILAGYFCTNRTYLSGYLHRNIPGKHFREWINDLRLSYAKQLMISDKLMSLTEVADKAGYSSLSHFTTTFSRSMGFSPAKWRALN